MRAVATSVLPLRGRPGTDYVLIARASTADRPFRALLADLESALRRVELGAAGHRSAAAGAGRA
jgi:ribonuclease P protein component